MTTSQPQLLVKMDMANLDRIVIWDMDGTLSDHVWRLPLILSGEKKWDEYFESSLKDPPHKWAVRLALTLTNAGYQNYIITGRPERTRGDTEAWLKHHRVPYMQLHMRMDEDRRQDFIIKKELLDKYFKKDQIEFVVEDRQQCVDMWRQEGLICLQPNFHI